MDPNGDSEGNFSVLALKPHKLDVKNFSCDYHMVPVGQFQQSDYPVSELAFLLCILSKKKDSGFIIDFLRSKLSGLYTNICVRELKILFL